MLTVLLALMSLMVSSSERMKSLLRTTISSMPGFSTISHGKRSKRLCSQSNSTSDFIFDKSGNSSRWLKPTPRRSFAITPSPERPKKRSRSSSKKPSKTPNRTSNALNTRSNFDLSLAHKPIGRRVPHSGARRLFFLSFFFQSSSFLI